MRLIDADELREQCHTIPDPKGIYCGLDIIEKYEIDDAPTVCDIEKIRQEFKNEAEMYKLIDRQMANVWGEAIKIMDKYIKGYKE